METEGDKINRSSSGTGNNKEIIPQDTLNKLNKYVYQPVFLTDPSEICSVESLWDSSEGRLSL